MTEDCLILVADDDDDVRNSIVEILALEGWRVAEARDGLEALERARRDNPHLLILDQRMPGLLGTQVVERLRSEGLSTSVILVTAALEARELAKELGIFHLRKPFTLDALLDAVATRCKDGGSV